MAQDSPIEWCDATWNPLRGCTRKSPGCQRCYAEQIAARFSEPGMAYEGLAHFVNGEARWTGKLRFVEKVLLQPLRWRRPRRVFVNSMSDLFHEDLPSDELDRIYGVMEQADWHIFQILTKRSAEMRDYTRERYRHRAPPKHIWHGVSIEDQPRADERLPDICETITAIAFLSVEPMLGPVVLSHKSIVAVDWVICGGESGPRKRPTAIEWHRALRDQCKDAGIAFFEKQIDKVRPIPNDLLIREFPAC